MMVPRTIRAAFTLIFLLTCFGLSAQQPEVFRDPHLAYHEGVDLMKYGQYESARRRFGDVLAGWQGPVNDMYINASYYHATTTMELFHRDAKFHMQEFILNFPESIWHQPALLGLGRYSFNRRDYKDAMEYFNRLNLRQLSPDDQDEVRFKTGFSAFELGDFAQARTSFFPLIDKQGPYTAPSNYYYGHIAFTEGNYQTALKSLNKAAADESFAPVVPYYITQIYHFQQKYDELIAYAAPLLDDASLKRKEEIAHLVGNAYYQKQDYAQAVPYLELFMVRNPNPVPADAYQMAYAYYRTGNHKASISHFATASKADDPALAQIATYQMADAYLQLGEKKYAQNAFRAASQMDHDREVTEDALFNYAKLAYELSFDPFHEAIQAFDRYLKAYPNSPRKDDAYAFLLRVHLATKNYPAALEAIDNMKDRGPIERADYQKAAYNHGTQLMRQSKNDDALKYFDASLKYREDPKLTALAHYWKGDLHYRKADYAKAISSYQQFTSNSASYGTPQFDNAQYSIGYCHFKLLSYGQSLDAFRKFTASPGIDKRRRHDALLRIGDLHLVRKEYDLAIKSYTDALNLNGTEGDYALFQIAMSHGYKENFERKVQELRKLFADYPATSLAAVGQFQLGDSYFLLNRLPEALTAFNTVINSHADSPYRKKALLKRGLVQYRQGAYNEAIATYKLVVKDYGVDAESREAIAVLRNIYLDLGRIDEYSAWLASVPNYSVSPSEIDSLTYRAAENMVADGKCAEASKAFGDYIRKFPNGLFIINSHYYRGDCAHRANDFAQALSDYEVVIAQPTSQFTEPSLLGAASIRFNRGEFEQALVHYNRLRSAASSGANVLEAEVGAMRSHYRLGRFKEAGERASAVLAQGSVPDRMVELARLIRGKAAYKSGDYASAKNDFSWLATNAKGAEGAEAKYLMAEMAYKQNDLSGAEKEIFELIQGYASFDTWKIKGFLLLADVYISRKDYFQARATLQSIISNVQDPEPVKEAQAKLERIAQLEAADQGQKEAERKASQPKDDDPYKEFIDEPNNSDNK